MGILQNGYEQGTDQVVKRKSCPSWFERKNEKKNKKGDKKRREIKPGT
jgi:hypothetical protein